MSKPATAVLFLGLGFMGAHVFQAGTQLVLARWAGKKLRADEL